MAQFSVQAYIVNQAISSSDFAGPWIPLTALTGINLMAAWTGSPVGSLKIQTCNDPNNLTNIPPLDYPGSSYAVNGAGNWGWDITDIHSAYVRLYYTHTSGAGNLWANYTAKGPIPTGYGTL